MGKVQIHTEFCEIEGCGALRYQRMRYCSKHYMRKYRHGDAQKVLKPRATPENRAAIFEKFARKGEGCWEWAGRLSTQGYGLMGGRKYAHRYSYETFHGRIPDGLEVMHSCDNRKCVNPAHLGVGTTRENHEDMIAKGRAAWQRPDSLKAIRDSAVRAALSAADGDVVVVSTKLRVPQGTLYRWVSKDPTLMPPSAIERRSKTRWYVN